MVNRVTAEDLYNEWADCNRKFCGTLPKFEELHTAVREFWEQRAENENKNQVVEIINKAIAGSAGTINVGTMTVAIVVYKRLREEGLL